MALRHASSTRQLVSPARVPAWGLSAEPPLNAAYGVLRALTRHVMPPADRTDATVAGRTAWLDPRRFREIPR